MAVLKLILSDTVWLRRTLSLAKTSTMKIEILPENDYGFSVYIVEGKTGIIYGGFNKIIPPIYEEVCPAFPKHFWAKENGLWCVKNFENQAIFAYYFKSVNLFYQKYACVSLDGKHFGFIGLNGEFVIPPNYFGGKFLGLEFFAVKNSDEKFGVINFQEKTIHPFSLEELPSFSKIVAYLLEKRKPLREWLRL